MVSEQATFNTITINAAEQDHLIDSVTVFQAGRAEIKRRVQLELKQGQNRIDIEHLPNCINEDSVRVQGSGTAVIFDVVYHSPYRQRTPDPSTDGEDSDEDSDEEYAQQYCSLQTLRKERNVVKQQSDFLDSYGRTLNSQNFGLDDIERFLDMYATRQNALEQRTQEIDLQIAQAEKALGKGQAKKPQDDLDSLAERRTKITVTVLSKEHGKAELLLTYVVSKASWTPIYDVRASLGQSSGKSSTVEVHYRASITQTTGEDWPEVGLTLSTAAPHRGATMPTLPTWRIGLPVSRPPRPSIRDYNGIASSISSRSRSFACRRSRTPSRSPTRIITVDHSASRHDYSESPNVIRTGSAYPADVVVQVPMDVRQADSVDAGVLSAKFSISGRSNIPSGVSTHKVLITSLNLQAEPEWVCIPRREESVFLRCKVVNSSQFTFLPGETSIFMDDNFVSKGRIQYVPPNESLQVSLGIDSGIRVTYSPVRTYNHTTSQSGFNLPGRPKNPTQNIVKYSQTITVRNSRQAAVSGLRVLDHVPVSNHSSIKVNVISPKGLRSANGSESITDEKGLQQAWVDVRKGIYARWAPPDIGGEGTIQWMCTIGAGKEIELQLEWEVSAPVGTSWRTL